MGEVGSDIKHHEEKPHLQCCVSYVPLMVWHLEPIDYIRDLKPNRGRGGGGGPPYVFHGYLFKRL